MSEPPPKPAATVAWILALLLIGYLGAFYVLDHVVYSPKTYTSVRNAASHVLVRYFQPMREADSLLRGPHWTVTSRFKRIIRKGGHRPSDTAIMVDPASEIVRYLYGPELKAEFAALGQGDFVEVAVKGVPNPGNIGYSFVVTSVRKVDPPAGFTKEPKWNGQSWDELEASE